MLRAGLVDRLVWLHAPLLLGGDGVPAVNALGLGALAEAPGFELLSSETVGPADMLAFTTSTGRIAHDARPGHRVQKPLANRAARP